MTLTGMVIKKEFRKTLELKKVLQCKIIADKLNDTLDMAGYGYTKENPKEIVTRKGVTFKLSEKPEAEEYFLGQLKGRLEYDKIDKVVMTFDFESKTSNVRNEIFYVLKGKKLKSILTDKI